jgi:hypothetical protein
MKTSRKAILILVLGLVEVVLLSWIFATNLPRRSADIDAFVRYQNAPTEVNERLWLQERQKTQREVSLRKSLGACLAFGNLILIGWVARRRTKPSTKDDALGSPDTPLDIR